MEALDKNVDPKARFINSVINHMVLHYHPNPLPNNNVHEFYECCVEQRPFEGARQPQIEGISFVDDI